MIRRVLRGALTRLRAREPRKEAPAATPPAPPPVDGGRPAAFEEEVEEAELEVEAEALAGWMAQEGRSFVFLDIREPHEVSLGHLADAWLIPMNEVPEHLAELPRDRTLIVYCAAGMRSFSVTHWLREQGLADAWSLAGGPGAWVQGGARWLQPAWDQPVRPTHRVGLAPRAAMALGLPMGTRGTVQAVERDPDGRLRIAVDVVLDGRRRRLADLAPEDLAV